MVRRKYLVKKFKRALTGLLAAVMVATAIPTGVVKETMEVEASSRADILSDTDRGIIYADSRTDFRDESIYFVITTRFYDGDESNNARTSEDKKANNPEDDPSWRGDFKGLIEKLDYIKALGFTAIWITPVVENKSGYDYHGYHAYDFSAVDTRYESNGITYQDLIDAVHAKGMKLIQDVVLNHTCNWGEKNLIQLNSDVYSERNQAVMNGKNEPENIYHHNGFCGGGDWDNYAAQNKTIADDCFDLETENPKVYNYLVDCYTKYINMGVDAFRVDTVKHISRLTFNSVFLPAFKKAGGDNFYMFGEVCTKGYDVWYRDCPPISTAFYTWKNDADWVSKWTTDTAANEKLVEDYHVAFSDAGKQPTSDNAFLKGNEYHTPDYSQNSGMASIDFQMHWAFNDANGAYNTARGEDKYFNDSTWNVTYVDSHDYAPDQCQTQRYTGGTDAWAENLSLMFTFRGIPCLYYGSEIEFQKGMPIDVGPNAPLSKTGRAYYGDNIEGNVTAKDFTVYGNVDGAVADTLNAPLSQHIQRLNRIRQAIPALRKGQYSTEGCSGSMAFKRRYTDDKTDSFALVTISGSSTFSGIPNGRYVDAVTGDVQNVTNGTLTANVSGKANMKVYVLDTEKTPAPGRVIPNGDYLTDGGAAEKIGPVALENVDISGIELSETKIEVYEGESEAVKATVLPANATDKKVTWTSSDEKIAKVVSGTITGISVGSATITAKTSNGFEKTVSVTVKENDQKPTSVKIPRELVSLVVGHSETLKVDVEAKNLTDKTKTYLNFESSDTSVATVDNNGKITAVGEGEAVITETNYAETSETVLVKVTKIPSSGQKNEKMIHFLKPESWGDDINVYAFQGSNALAGAWPGTKMTKGEDGFYDFECDFGTDLNIGLVFNDGNNQTKDLIYERGASYDENGVFYPQVINSTGIIDVQYILDDNIIANELLFGEPNKMTFIEGNYESVRNNRMYIANRGAIGNVEFQLSAQTIEVTVKEQDPPGTIKLIAGKESITTGEKLELSVCGALPIEGFNFYVYNKSTNESFKLASKSSSNIFQWTAVSAGEREFYAEIICTGGNIVKTNSVNVSVKPKTIQGVIVTATASEKSIKANEKTTISASVTGEANGLRYSYIVYNKATNEWYRLANQIAESSFEWTAGTGGDRLFFIDVTDENGKTYRSNAILVQVEKTAKTALGSTAKASVDSAEIGQKVTITANAAGGAGLYKYSYIIFNKKTGKWFRLGNKLKSNTFTWTVPTSGDRVFYVDVTDGEGNLVRTKAVNVSVK